MFLIHLEGTRDRHTNVWSDPVYSSIGLLYIHANKLEILLNVSFFSLLSGVLWSESWVLSNPHGPDIPNLKRSKCNSAAALRVLCKTVGQYQLVSSQWIRMEAERERTLAKGRSRRCISKLTKTWIFVPYYFKIT